MHKELRATVRMVAMASIALLAACARPLAPPPPPPPPKPIAAAPLPVKTVVAPIDQNQTIIDNGVQIGADTRIGYGAVIGSHVTIGKDNFIGSHSYISDAILGDRVTISPGVKIGN